MLYLLLIFLALLSVHGVGAQEELPPYIHYFDHLRGGLVIERADGTDSRMISDVPMDAGPPVWSASGKWMVIGNEMIVSTDGNQRPLYPLPALITYYPQTLWSPKDDVILAIGFEPTSGSIFAQLYDVETQIILANFEFQNPTFREEDLDLYWEPDGTRAFVSWPNGVVTLYRDGQTAMWVDNIRGYDAEAFYRGRLFSVAGRTDEVLTLRIETLSGEKQIDIEDRIELSRNTYIVRWSPTLEHALIYARKCSDTHCDGWLKLVDWEDGEIRPVTPAISIRPLRPHCYVYICTELWSPDGRYAVLSETSDDANNIYILDVSTVTSRQVIAGERVTWYGWSPDGLLYMMREGGLNVVAYNPATDDKSVIDLPPGTQPYQLSISPTGDYFGLSTASATVIDGNGNTVGQTIPHSYSTLTACCPNSYTWYSKGKWLMAEYVIAFAGGGNGPIAAVLFDLEGTTRRELPKGGFSGFVPDRAINYLPTGQITSVKKDPVFTLPQKDIVDGVGWHPTDPDQLVTHSREDGLIFWSLAGSEPEIIRQEILAFPFPGQLPIGLRLFWLPEQDVVAFWNGFGIVTVNQENGELERVEGIDYARFETTDESRIVRCSISDHMLEIETALDLISCGRTSILYRAPDLDSPVIYADIDTQVITALDIGGRTNIWTGDARNNIAVVGGIHDCCFAVASTETGALLDEFHGTAYSLAISADGRRLATTSAGMTAIWDISEYLPTE